MLPYFGPANAEWANRRALMAVGNGLAPAGVLTHMSNNGGKAAMATAMRQIGEDNLKKLPYVGTIVSTVDFLRGMPVIGDWLQKLDGLVDELVEEGLDKAADKVKDFGSKLKDKIF